MLIRLGEQIEIENKNYFSTILKCVSVFIYFIAYCLNVFKDKLSRPNRCWFQNFVCIDSFKTYCGFGFKLN